MYSTTNMHFVNAWWVLLGSLQYKNTLLLSYLYFDWSCRWFVMRCTIFVIILNYRRHLKVYSLILASSFYTVSQKKLYITFITLYFRSLLKMYARFFKHILKVWFNSFLKLWQPCESYGQYGNITGFSFWPRVGCLPPQFVKVLAPVIT